MAEAEAVWSASRFARLASSILHSSHSDLSTTSRVQSFGPTCTWSLSCGRGLSWLAAATNHFASPIASFCPSARCRTSSCTAGVSCANAAAGMRAELAPVKPVGPRENSSRRWRSAFAEKTSGRAPLAKKEKDRHLVHRIVHPLKEFSASAIGEGPGEVPQYGNINGVFHLRNRSVPLRRRPYAQICTAHERHMNGT